MMTPEEFADRMEELFPGNDYDQEISHGMADVLMCRLLIELGYGEGVGIFIESEKWYA